ncbi:MAG: hypothetical protein NVS3B28_06150 [Candidatus Velthaea sp.]
MLGPALFLVAILFLTATVAIGGVGAFARATVHDAANAAIRTGFAHALADYQQSIAAQIQASEGPNYYADAQKRQNIGEIPSIPALADPVHAIAAPAARTERIGVAFVSEASQNTTAVSPDCTAGLLRPGDVAVRAQCAPWVAESRLSAQIVITVYGGDPAQAGATALAARTQTFAFRLFADAPYVALTGLKDGDARHPDSDDPNAVDPHEGDASGFAPAAGPLLTTAAPAAGDTTIHVLYDCQNAGAACPQNPNPPGDVPRDVPWQNGNITPP